MSRLPIKQMSQWVEEFSPFPTYGHVTNVLGIIIEGYCPNVAVGGVVEVYSLDRKQSCMAEVVGFREDKVLIMPLGELYGIGLGSPIAVREKSATIKIGPELIGRTVDGLLRPLDGGPKIECEEVFSIYSSPINPLKRARIHDALDLGIRSVNGLLTVGKGQRMSILAGSGVGKSMLLGMMARNTSAQVNVIALIGERGREVREFIERDLGPEGMARSIVVCATSDVSPLIRMRAAFAATTIAEYFRKKGADVLLMMDSITRFSMAQREIGLSAGEPPTTRGYPPSAFAMLPKLMERAGTTSSGGSITGIYTVLIEADDVNDPIGDAVRSVADGHILLSRKLAAKGHYPAIDVPYSASRVMGEVISDEHKKIAYRMKSILATYAEAEDLVNIGAYVKGSNAAIDESIQFIQPIRDFLKQPFDSKATMAETVALMSGIFDQGAKSGRKS
ncbi:MAG: fliI [Bacteriovoracaceae bacterium]|nr:fliI [Bacteriovoracaceae bacterium]